MYIIIKSWLIIDCKNQFSSLIYFVSEKADPEKPCINVKSRGKI